MQKVLLGKYYQKVDNEEKPIEAVQDDTLITDLHDS